MEGNVVLTGIKPTAQPHIGNYLGAIRPGLELARGNEERSFFFIADAHALTTVQSAAELKQLTYEVAATWLAFGLDPTRTLFYRQSDVPETFELAWLLACRTPKGFMNKSHAYKAARDANVAAGEDDDAGVNMGLFTYPVLMAADILIMDADEVPVGQDQVQHVEIARDMAQRVNHTFGEGTLRLPTARVRAEAALVPGVDGRKMSKSYGNSLPCFLGAKAMRKAVMRIQTDSTPPEAPKDPDRSLVFQIHKAVAPATAAARAEQYRTGLSWGEAKALLAEDVEILLAEPRARFEAQMADLEGLERTLLEGAARARAIAGPVLRRVRAAHGFVR